MDAPNDMSNVSSVEATDMGNALLYLHVLSRTKRICYESQFLWFQLVLAFRLDCIYIIL